jgi:hypothetical protein
MTIRCALVAVETGTRICLNIVGGSDGLISLLGRIRGLDGRGLSRWDKFLLCRLCRLIL